MGVKKCQKYVASKILTMGATNQLLAMNWNFEKLELSVEMEHSKLKFCVDFDASLFLYCTNKHSSCLHDWFGSKSAKKLNKSCKWTILETFFLLQNTFLTKTKKKYFWPLPVRSAVAENQWLFRNLRLLKPKITIKSEKQKFSTTSGQGDHWSKWMSYSEPLTPKTPRTDRKPKLAFISKLTLRPLSININYTVVTPNKACYFCSYGGLFQEYGWFRKI